jgi:hypothetical protein
MPTPRPSADVVLRWLNADPARTSAEAARKYGIPEGTVRSWKKRAADENRHSNLTVLHPEGVPVDPAEIAALFAMSPKDLLRVGVIARLVRLARCSEDESPADMARIVSSLLDRAAAIEALDPVKEQDPTSDEGRKQLAEALKVIPAEVLEAALAAKRSA